MWACSPNEPSIINRYAEAHLTNQIELQFRFKVNDKIFTDEKMYKVKVLIHDEELRQRLAMMRLYMVLTSYQMEKH